MKQYLELQEPAQETIHIFCDINEIEEKLLDNEIIVFFKEEECKFIRFNNHIFKYKVEFHQDYLFNEEMKHILCFVDNDDESKIDTIQGLKNDILEPEANCRIIVLNSTKLNKDEEQEKIEYFKNKFESMSNDIVSISQYGDDVKEYHNLFTRLIKGEEKIVQVNEETCCRI